MSFRLPLRIDWGFALIICLSVGSGLFLLWRDGWRVVLDVLGEDILLFFDVLPKVLAGTLIGAFVTLLAPRAVIRRWIGEGSGFAGIVIAATAGMLFPAGPFTVFPVAAAFIAAGADRGAAVAFISGWLLLGLNRAIIWELPFFGPAFIGWRSLGALWMPVAAGWAARAIPLRIVMRL